MTRFAPALLLTVTAAFACGGSSEAEPPAQEAAPVAALEQVSQEPACWLMRGTAAEAAERPSPRDSASVAFAGGTVKVCYGAPSARGRTIIGGQDPFGQPWRMGADEATALHTTVPIQIGTARLGPGVYSIFGVPTAEEWTVVVNHNAQRWGIPISPQVREHDLGQVGVRPERIEHIERLRYRFEPAGANRVDLLMEFETTRVRIPIQTGTD
jgi:hypothetical protein